MSYVDDVQRAELIAKVSKWKTQDDPRAPRHGGKLARLVSAAVISKGEGDKIYESFDIQPEDKPADIVQQLIETGQTIANGGRRQAAVAAVFFFVSDDKDRVPVRSGASPWAREFPMLFDPVGGRDSEWTARTDLRHKENQEATALALAFEHSAKTCDTLVTQNYNMAMTCGQLMEDARLERVNHATVVNGMMGQMVTMFQTMMTALDSKAERDVRVAVAVANLEDSRGWKKVQQDLAAACIPQVAGIVGLGANALAQYAAKSLGHEPTPLQVRLLKALKPVVGDPVKLAETLCGLDLTEAEQNEIIMLMPELNQASNAMERIAPKPPVVGGGFDLTKFKTIPGVNEIYNRRAVQNAHHASVAGNGAGK